jgi:PBP1b-binding outer membrane lipoprotein LpoB
MAMKQNALLIVAILFLSACATTSPPQSEIKQITPETLEQLMPEAVASYSLQEIVADTQQAKTPEEIIAKIKASDSRYDLSVSKLIELNQQGVDVKVLSYIQQSNALAKQNYIAEEINKAQQEKAEALKKLSEERLMQMHRYYDPFWHPYFGPYYHYRLYR